MNPLPAAIPTPWELFGPVLAWGLHVALALLAAPLLLGASRTLAARLGGRHGPSPLQFARDLRRLLRKRPVLDDHASVVTRAAPGVAAGAALTAAAIAPGFAGDVTFGVAFGGAGDLLLLGGLLFLPRAAAVLAVLDRGTADGALEAGQALNVALLAGPVLLAAASVFAVPAGGTDLSGIGAAVGESLRLWFALDAPGTGPATGSVLDPALAPALGAPLLLGALALAAAAMVGTPGAGGAAGGAAGAGQDGRDAPPGGVPTGASGRHLALWELADALALVAWLSVLAAVVLPFGTASAAEPLGWPLGLACWAAKLAALGAALAAARALTARHRTAGLLGGALLLALLGLVLLFAAAGTA